MRGRLRDRISIHHDALPGPRGSPEVRAARHASNGRPPLGGSAKMHASPIRPCLRGSVLQTSRRPYRLGLLSQHQNCFLGASEGEATAVLAATWVGLGLVATAPAASTYEKTSLPFHQ